ncbi:probable serine/threonine-protein kinase OSR1 at N-terminal half [Coccomyxa sp. Obi]|nr:probable serine/threonine-protein kinase OSR1 at N-terminal half [Coccomyxa sp. Obi]
MLRRRRSSGKLSVVWDELDDFPANADDYELMEEIGVGATARVWMAHCKPKDTKVAIKLTDLEKFQGNTALDQLIQEAQVMKGFRHPNLLMLHCSFIHGSDLWLVMPFIAGGSLANLISSKFPDGMEEDMIATIARDVLQGLQYLHAHDSMHRDLKAANMLVADDGHILLADFGACATLEREARLPSLQSAMNKDSNTPEESPTDSWSPLRSPTLPNVPEESGDSAVSWGMPSTPSFSMRSASSSQWSRYLTRSTFIGTTAYMAPEVMDPREGYTQSADIWSFGICLLELARGRVPISNCSFTSLVMQVVQNPAPTLHEYCGGHKFSQAMHDFVAKCLDKEAMARLGAAELLKHPFIKRAKDERYLAQRLLGQATLKASRSFFMARHASGSPDNTLVTTRHSKSAGRAPLPVAGRTSFKAAEAARNAAVFQIVWTVWSGGRRFYVVFHMTKSHSLARVSINGVELLRRKYKLWQQLNFHADMYKVAVESPLLPQLTGKELELKVHVGFAVMMGQATLDSVVLDAPDCSITYADMSEPSPSLVATPAVPPVSPFHDVVLPPADAGQPPAGLVRSVSAGHPAGMAISNDGGSAAAPAPGPPESPSSLGDTSTEGTPSSGSGLAPAVSVPQTVKLEDVGRPMPHAISEENLASLDRPAGEQMASALKRLLV